MSDGDGFSGPDPADVPMPTDDDPSTIPPGDGGGGDDVIVVSEEVHCENCEHFDVCAYYAGVKPMLEDPQTGHGEPPFDAGSLAAICNFFELSEPDE